MVQNLIEQHQGCCYNHEYGYLCYMRLHYRRLHFVRILRGNEHKKQKKYEILCVFCAFCVPDFQATIAYSLVSSARASTSSIDFTG